ncbi:MAG: GNAT family N-acetyltransferase [Acidobacteriota bacterium]
MVENLQSQGFEQGPLESARERGSHPRSPRGRGVRLVCERCIVREWSREDEPALARYANNRRVSVQLRDRFPFPYSNEDARRFIEYAAGMNPVTAWAIEIGGEAAGGIGLMLSHDVERISAEVGYWVGEPHWGRGIATEALSAVTARAFEQFHLARVFAVPFAHNTGSIRVLEKAGYVLEGRMRQSAVKDGVICDQLLFAAYADAPRER